MPDRSRKRRPTDPNQAAASIVAEATAEAPPEAAASQAAAPVKKPRRKNPAAVALGRLGGKKGGPARAKKLTAERKVEIARLAARKRWEREKR